MDSAQNSTAPPDRCRFCGRRPGDDSHAVVQMGHHVAYTPHTVVDIELFGPTYRTEYSPSGPRLKWTFPRCARCAKVHSVRSELASWASLAPPESISLFPARGEGALIWVLCYWLLLPVGVIVNCFALVSLSPNNHRTLETNLLLLGFLLSALTLRYSVLWCRRRPRLREYWRRIPMRHEEIQRLNRERVDAEAAVGAPCRPESDPEGNPLEYETMFDVLRGMFHS